MGLCSSSPEERETLERERRLNKLINSGQNDDRDQEEQIMKLLLLGTGESGKSTLFKQIIQLYGKGFSEDARAPYSSIVHANTVISMKTLIAQSRKLDEKYDTLYADECAPAASFVEKEVKHDAVVNPEIGRHIATLWADPGIRKTFELRHLFQLSDSASWFFDRVLEISREGYLPSYQDVLRCRARTTGIVETSFQIEGNRFRMLDVGGQRNERKKWFHCFEDVTAVIYVAAINEYDQVLYEDGVTNRLLESLELFGEICNSRWFRKTSMILFLNKSDLFKDKIAHVDLKHCFPHYEDGLDFDRASAYIRDQFVAKNEVPQRKKVYVHITCATNTENIDFTFNVVKDIIVKNGLKECGLLV